MKATLKLTDCIMFTVEAWAHISTNNLKKRVIAAARKKANNKPFTLAIHSVLVKDKIDGTKLSPRISVNCHLFVEESKEKQKKVKRS